MDLKAVTLKTAMWLTLILHQRAETTFTLDMRYIKNDTHTKYIAFPSVLKHIRPDRHLKPLILKRYLAGTKICPVELLHTYLIATKEIRKSETKLLNSFLKPHGVVTVKKISRWIKNSLKEAGIDSTTFQCHSPCNSSSSKAKLNGANITRIFNVGGWSNDHTFAKFCECINDKTIEDYKSLL